MDRRMVILREEIAAVEDKIITYWSRAERFKNAGLVVHYDKYRELVHHYSYRRRFYIKELCRIQLKEFNHE